MITLDYVLTLSGILFAIAVAGVFLNRKNIILLLMCIELMLLAVNSISSPSRDTSATSAARFSCSSY